MNRSVELIQHQQYIQKRRNQCNQDISESTQIKQKEIIELLLSGASYPDILRQFYVTSALDEGVSLSFNHKREAELIASKDYYVTTTSQSYLIYPKKVQRVLDANFVPPHENILDYLKDTCGIRVIKNLPKDFPYSDTFVYDITNYLLLDAIYYHHTRKRMPAWETIEHN